MRFEIALSWLLLAIWSVWLAYLQGWLAAGWGPWCPELGLVLLLGLTTSLRQEDFAKAAIVVALGRIAVSIDSPAAILVGFWLASFVLQSTTQVVTTERMPTRFAFGFGGGLALAAWLTSTAAGADWIAEAGLLAAQSSDSQTRGSAMLGSGSGNSTRAALGALMPWRSALVTAVLSAVLGPVFARLPGLTPLRKRRSWHLGFG